MSNFKELGFVVPAYMKKEKVELMKGQPIELLQGEYKKDEKSEKDKKIKKRGKKGKKLDKNNTYKYCQFYLLYRNNGLKKNKYSRLLVKLFGRRAEFMAENFCYGDPILLQGNLICITQKDEDEDDYKDIVYLQVEDIQFVPDYNLYDEPEEEDDEEDDSESSDDDEDDEDDTPKSKSKSKSKKPEEDNEEDDDDDEEEKDENTDDDGVPFH